MSEVAVKNEAASHRDVDHEQAAQYIEALTGSRETAMTWCLLHDKKVAGMRPQNFYGSLSDLAPRLTALNKGGYGVFLAVNEVKAGAPRRQVNIIGLRALFVESDHGEMHTPALAASFSVQSARGRHVYWKLGQGEVISLFSQSQKHLAVHFDSDPVVHDLPRLMRVPGFLHQKREPFLVTFEAGSGQAHTISEILNAHPVDANQLRAICKPKAPASPGSAWGEASLAPVDLPSMGERKARAWSYVKRMPSAIEGQGGDCQTFKAACYVVRSFAVDNFDDALDVMRQYNATCSPPWNEADLAEKITNALRHGSGAFGSMLERRPRGALARMQTVIDTATKEGATNDAGEAPGSAPKPEMVSVKPTANEDERGRAQPEVNEASQAEDATSEACAAPDSSQTLEVKRVDATASEAENSHELPEADETLWHEGDVVREEAGEQETAFEDAVWEGVRAEAPDEELYDDIASPNELMEGTVVDTPSEAASNQPQLTGDGLAEETDARGNAMASSEAVNGDLERSATCALDVSTCDEARVGEAPETTPYSLELITLLAHDPGNALNPDVIKSLARLRVTDEEEYTRCLIEVKQSGLGMMNEVKRAINRQAAEDSQAAAVAKMNAAESSVVASLPAAFEVVCGEHRVPHGYQVSWHGITKLVQKTHRDGTVEVKELNVCSRPLVITAMLDKLGDEGTLVEMAFRTRDTKRWVKITAGREVAMTSRLLNTLAEHRYPAHSGNANLLVEYLAAYETANEKVIPRRRSTVQMGWHKSDKRDVFVLGDACLVPDKETTPITFVGDSAGDKHLASCYQRKGTLEGWCKAMELVVKYPRVELAVVGALATMLMDVLQAPSFAMDFCGQSSTGKTTTMGVAASAFGVPDERSQHSLIHSWNTTQVGIERLASTNRDLPLLMDETKQAPTGPRGRNMVPEAIYQITNGQGKARGAIQGRRKTLYWRTLMLTTGECAAVDQSKDMGPAARVLTLWGSPFGSYSEDVAKIEALINENYGHAGLLFAQWLVTNRASCAAVWRQRYREYVKDLQGQLVEVDPGAASRLAKYLALLELTARLVREAVPGIPWNGSAAYQVLSEVAKGAAPFDRPLEALRHMYHQAVSEKATFWGCHDLERPPLRYNGHWQVTVRNQGGKESDEYACLGFLPGYLEDHLAKAGYDVASTLKLWFDRGWLQTHQEKDRRTIKVRINRLPARVYAVKREAIVQALGLHPGGQHAEASSPDGPGEIIF